MPFLGSKSKLLDSISPYFRGNVLLDLFMGSGAVSLRGKVMGMKIIGGDVARRSKIFGIAVIANNNVRISEEDVASLFVPLENNGFIQKNFVPEIFLPETAKVLDNGFARAKQYESPKREQLEYLLSKFILSGRQFGGFQVGKKDNEMVMQGRIVELIESVSSEARAEKIAASIQPEYKRLVAIKNKINRAIFNNGEEHEIYQTDCFDLLDKLRKENRKIDTVYMDSPYRGSQIYSSHYKILDQILEQKLNVEIDDTAFNKNNALENFDRLFEKASFIENFVVSMGYNPNSDSGIKGEELLGVLQRYKPNARLITLKHQWAIANIAKSGRQENNCEYILVTD